MLDILTCVGNGEISKRSEQCSKYNIAHKNLPKLETIVNNELAQIHTWLCANKLSLNIDKSNFVLFHPAQRKLAASINLCINQMSLNEKDNIRYLGITLDKNLNWKKHIQSISKKIKRSIDILSKTVIM